MILWKTSHRLLKENYAMTDNGYVVSQIRIPDKTNLDRLSRRGSQSSGRCLSIVCLFPEVEQQLVHLVGTLLVWRVIRLCDLV